MKARRVAFSAGSPSAAWLSASTLGGPVAEVIELGRGAPEELEAHRKEIAGRIVLVRQQSMFAAGAIHYRGKRQFDHRS